MPAMPRSWISLRQQFHLVQAFEIRHLRRIARLDQRVEGGADKLRLPAAQHHLLAEQIGLAFVLEGRFHDARAAAAERRGIGQPERMRAAAGVLPHRDQARQTVAALDIPSATGDPALPAPPG